MSSSISAEKDYVKFVDSSTLVGDKKIRFNQVLERVKQIANLKPDYVIVAPGRVNLIGEHIDYHGFSVLPMAIEKSIWLACFLEKKKNNNSIGTTLLLNTNENHREWKGAHSFIYGSGLSKSHEWANYFLCGYHGILVKNVLNVETAELVEKSHQIANDTDLLSSTDTLLKKLDDFRIIVDSDLPEASGLSSSSAFICASALATSLLVHRSGLVAGEPNEDKILIDQCKLAEDCSRFEHLVGTHGGGMDQAVIMTAQEEYAKHVEFLPRLKCENVRLPDSTVWLVSHSGISFPKAATSCFNMRVLETKLGAAIIAKAMGASPADIGSNITLSHVKNEYFSGKTTQEIVQFIKDRIFNNRNEYTLDEICMRLEMSKPDVKKKFNISDSLMKSEPHDELSLLNRCEHIFEEAERVEKFKSICDTTTDVVMLGQLMTQSHYSLRDKYDCSHTTLDRLVGVALDAGALGSRVTGAGWGGCIVTLVERSKCDTVFERLKEVSKFTFLTRPQSGCHVIRVCK